MSLYSSVAPVRFSNLGILSVGVLAFVLVTLQGCAPTVTASSAKEPGASPPSLGALRADSDSLVAPTYHHPERNVAARSPNAGFTRFRVR
jgi:hypothetical protein